MNSNFEAVILASSLQAYTLAGAEADVTDDKARAPPIQDSFIRKALGPCRVYAECHELVFFMYERFITQKFFSAHVRAKHYGVTADIMVRTTSLSTGFWEIVQDSLADLVRVMSQKELLARQSLVSDAEAVRQGEMAGFPNLFITIAPAEWKFPRPFFLFPYLEHLLHGAFWLALHMHRLVTTIWTFLCRLPARVLLLRLSGLRGMRSSPYINGS